MGAQGSTTIDFGAFPGDSNASVNVTGQTGILAASSLVDAWIFPKDSADHTRDEHICEEITITAGEIVDGVGFTIYARANNSALYGEWNVAWVWN